MILQLAACESKIAPATTKPIGHCSIPAASSLLDKACGSLKTQLLLLLPTTAVQPQTAHLSVLPPGNPVSNKRRDVAGLTDQPSSAAAAINSTRGYRAGSMPLHLRDIVVHWLEAQNAS